MSALDSLREQAMACTACQLAKNRTNVVFGVGNPNAELMFVGEGPGREEDLAGEPFVGRSGKLLDQLMGQELGIDRSQCYIGNVIKCRPPNNRDPLEEEIAACRHFLEEQVREIDPLVIITLGNFATHLLLGTADGIKKVRGRSYTTNKSGLGRQPAIQTGIPAYNRKNNSSESESGLEPGEEPTMFYLVPTYHPAAALRGGATVVAEMRADFSRAKLLLGDALHG
jgi:DNA polymerase